MTAIQTLVSTAINLDRKIAALEEELKSVKERLVAHAKLDEENQTETDKGGWSWSAQDPEGNLARVTVAGRSIKEGIDLEGELTTKVRALLPKDVFARLFVTATYYKLVDDFRTRASEILAKPYATKLLKLVTSKGKTSVSFETKKEAA